MSDQTGKTFGVIGALVGLVAVAVAAAAYAVNANAAANSACRRIEEMEPRVRVVEQTIPRIDERLKVIQEFVERHDKDGRKGTP